MTPEEREQYLNDLEKATIFKTKLFGNIEFVGELYRRKILPKNTLMHVFDSLLGMTEDLGIDDIVVEGAVNLMEKIGIVFEEQAKKKDDSQQSAQKIFDRFNEL
jgi:hypothetical protein